MKLHIDTENEQEAYYLEVYVNGSLYGPADMDVPEPGPAPSGFAWGKRSQERMVGLQPQLLVWLEEIIKATPIDLTILEGVRSIERQKELVAKGTSQTMNSRHLTGHAVDIAPLVNGQVTWDWEYYNEIAPVLKLAAEELDYDIEWGGDWNSFKDGPHWQLSWEDYPV